MSRALLAVLLITGVTGFGAACKDKGAPKGDTKGSDSAAPVEVNWLGCDEALDLAASFVPERRAQAVINSCHVCGDWGPILDWNTPSTDGGPKRVDIENAMARCNAFCNGEAKLKFLGTLDDARGKTARTPWRLLAQICKEEVSAGPDVRFMSATYFALDRIARAAAARGGETAKRLQKLELPLPPLTVVGTGFDLPELTVERISHGPKGDRVMSTPVGGVQITLLAGNIYVGHLPKARLGANGVAVDLGPDAYPGKVVSREDFAGVLAKLTAGSKAPIVVLAPKATLAAQLVPVITAAAPVAPVYLAAGTRPGERTAAAAASVAASLGSGARAVNAGASEWQIPMAIPIALDADARDAIHVTAHMSVQDLATELAKRANQNVDRIGVTAQ